MRITSRIAFIAAGLFGAAAIVVGFIPYTVSGWGAVCPSAFTALTGGTNAGQGIINVLSGGACTKYVGQMELLIAVGLVIAVVALVVGILTRKKARLAAGHLPLAYAAAAPAAPGYAPQTTQPDGPAHAPSPGADGTMPAHEPQSAAPAPAPYNEQPVPAATDHQP